MLFIISSTVKFERLSLRVITFEFHYWLFNEMPGCDRKNQCQNKSEEHHCYRGNAY